MIETTSIPRPPYIKPTIFDEYFGMGHEETASPFLTSTSRRWAANLSLKASIVAAFFLLIAFTLSFFPSLLPLSHLMLLFVYFLAGIPFLIASIEDLASFDINIDVLMTLAAFSSVFIGSSMEGGLLLILFALAGAMQDSVTAKAKGSLNNLYKLSPTRATVIDQGNLLERSVKDINLGTKILVRAGEVVPLDGEVIEGISSVNLVHLTGESLPVTKKIGDEVPAGARNLDGTLTLTVNRTSADSTLTQIIQLVTQAQESKPLLQQWFDQLSRGYALSIIFLSILFALFFPYFFHIPFLGYEGSVYRAVAFLVAASPCALIIAVPIAYLSAVSACARKGILLKGGIVLDALSQCSTIAFDKTGTLTLGNLTLIGIQSIGNKGKNFTNEELIAAAYGLEKNAVHPIARAICEYAMENGVKPEEISDFKAVPGYGIEGKIYKEGKKIDVFMGNPEYLLRYLTPEQQQQMEEMRKILGREGNLLSVLLLGSDLFIFNLRDTVRPGLKETLDRLKALERWNLIMLTGDHEESAKKIAGELGIDQYYSNLRPENKLEYVTKLTQAGGLVMVGDGINDAPALARSSVGICMGKVGSGTAVDAADVILLQDNLERLDWLMLKGIATSRIVKENLCIAAGAILIAVLPALAGWIPLWTAVVMHEGGTVLVGLNALRLLR